MGEDGSKTATKESRKYGVERSAGRDYLEEWKRV